MSHPHHDRSLVVRAFHSKLLLKGANVSWTLEAGGDLNEHQDAKRSFSCAPQSVRLARGIETDGLQVPDWSDKTTRAEVLSKVCTSFFSFRLFGISYTRLEKGKL